MVKLNVVHEFKYVGSTETETAKLDREVDIRIQRMAGAYSKLAKNVFNVRHLKTRAKLRTYRTVVLANGLYGCASWNTRKEHIDKMEAWQYRTLRTIMGYNWKDFISYADILQLTAKVGLRIYPIEVEVRATRLRHVQRMEKIRLPYIALHGQISEGGRRKGAPECVLQALVHACSTPRNPDIQNTYSRYLGI